MFEHVDHDTHTLTLLDTGETFITEHAADPGFTLHSGCLVFKIAHRAFETSPGVRMVTDHPPKPGRYRVAIADNGTLDVFGRIPDPTTPNEQETHA